MPSTAPESAVPKSPADQFVESFRAEVAALDVGDDTLAATVAERVAERAGALLAGAPGDDLEPEAAAAVVLAVLEETLATVAEPPRGGRSVDRTGARDLLRAALRPRRTAAGRTA